MNGNNKEEGEYNEEEKAMRSCEEEREENLEGDKLKGGDGELFS